MDTVDVVLAHHWTDHRACCPGGTGRIQEGCPNGEHRFPDETVEVEEGLARTLVDAGVANFASEADAIAAGGDRQRVAVPVEERAASSGRAPTKTELLAQAQALGLDVAESKTKKEIAAAIAEAEAESGGE